MTGMKGTKKPKDKISLAKLAKVSGVCYKTLWDNVELLRNMENLLDSSGDDVES